MQARWPSEQVRIEGRATAFRQTADSGNWATFHFCPECGSDVYYTNDGPSVEEKLAGLIAIPVGAFDDPLAFSPRFSVWEERKHHWVEIVGNDVEHSD